MSELSDRIWRVKRFGRPLDETSYLARTEDGMGFRRVKITGILDILRNHIDEHKQWIEDNSKPGGPDVDKG